MPIYYPSNGKALYANGFLVGANGLHFDLPRKEFETLVNAGILAKDVKPSIKISSNKSPVVEKLPEEKKVVNVSDINTEIKIDDNYKNETKITYSKELLESMSWQSLKATALQNGIEYTNKSEVINKLLGM